MSILICRDEKNKLINLLEVIMRFNKVSLAYEDMVIQIDAGVEYPDAHTDVCVRYDLTDEESKEVTNMYDRFEPM